MKLALVHDWLTGMRGGEKCLEVLCRRFPDAELHTLVHATGSTSPAIERMDIRTSYLQRLPGATTRYRYLLPLMPDAVRRLSIGADVDLVVSLSHAVAKGVQVPAGVPHVCYCFTPMRYAWHMREEYFAAQHAGEDARTGLIAARLSRASLSAARNLVLDRLQDWDRQASGGVTHFVAISQTIAQRISECYGRSSRVIYPPVDVDFYTPADVPREDFYLCVSALVPYKRLDLAIRACNRLRRPLKIIGHGPERTRLARLAGPTIEFLDWQSDETIRDHLRRCRALLFPGLEDFGIVPVEAQACGAPVIALGHGGATETVLEASAQSPGSGLFFDEPTVDALVAAIERFEAHPQWFCSERARRQAEPFARERFERELIDYLHQVAYLCDASSR